MLELSPAPFRSAAGPNCNAAEFKNGTKLVRFLFCLFVFTTIWHIMSCKYRMGDFISGVFLFFFCFLSWHLCLNRLMTFVVYFLMWWNYCTVNKYSPVTHHLSAAVISSPTEDESFNQYLSRNADDIHLLWYTPIMDQVMTSSMKVMFKYIYEWPTCFFLHSENNIFMCELGLV